MAYRDRTPALATPLQVLEGLAGARDHMRALERANVILAVEWAKWHPDSAPGGVPLGNPDADRPAPRRRVVPGVPLPSPYDEARWVWSDLADMGALSFDPLAVADFAVACGLTEHSARKLLRESLMLVHLLPGVWSRVCEGEVEVWRARALAADCWGLSFEAIAYIDQAMSARAIRITQLAREQIVEEALRATEPRESLSREELAMARRDVEVLTRAQKHGVVPVMAHLDTVDALALEAALRAGARALKELGSDAPLNVRRSWALGDLARAATGQSQLLPLAVGGAGGDERPHWNGAGATRPESRCISICRPRPRAPRARVAPSTRGSRPPGSRPPE